ncbi:MAG: HsdM family class I SAM-dependent methyltransferase, partial [Romboutsia sp.]|uniref:HsdM family class I SAM-dependent methyltransferase n=1 Tax=Romboutsia sp. TaxID=1965302 RepID=UPI003F323556
MGLNLGETKDDNFKLSKNYEDSLDIITKQNKGIYYTPKIIVEYIIKKTLKKHDIVNNPYPKVLDISCGCGNFLLETYDILYDLIEENIYDLKDKYGNEYWNNNNIHNHIISNCIYGADIDKEAIKILKEAFRKKDEDCEIEKFNLYNCDSLDKKWNEKFDYIIGNPPYIGHKKLEKDYKKFLSKNYTKVYKDKSDLYFCFYQKIIELLSENGMSSIITPRYFLESPSGKYLREYIIDSVKIDEIVDFLGCSIFKN